MAIWGAILVEKIEMRFNEESTLLTTDQTGQYNHQNLPDENLSGDIESAEEKRIRFPFCIAGVASSCRQSYTVDRLLPSC